MEILPWRTANRWGRELNAKRQRDLFIITELLRCSRHKGKAVRYKNLEDVTDA